MQKREVVISRTRVVLSQVLACSALNVLLVGLGASISFVTTVLPELLNAKEGLSIDQYQASWFGSTAFLVQPLGSIFSGPLVDCVGRKKALFLVNIPHIIAWILMHYANDVPALFVANALLGFGTGLMEAPSITYAAEISEQSVRGALAALTSGFTSLGVFSAYMLGTRLPWRSAALVCLVVPITTMLLVIVVPETPIWLLSKGRKEEALRSLQYVRGWTTRERVEKEFKELELYSEKARDCVVCVHKNKYRRHQNCNHMKQFFIKRALLKFRYVMLTKETLRPFQLVMAYFSIHGICGLTPIRSNMINVARAYGMNGDPKNIIVIVALLSIIMTVLSASLIRIVGKRILILSTTAGTTLLFLSMAVYAWIYLPSEVFTYKPETFPLEKSYVPLILFYILICVSQLGIPWVLLSEVFPFRSRGAATGLAAASSYFITFLASKTNLDVETTLHLPGSFVFYAMFGLFGFVYLYFYLPETEGKSLEDIEKLYSGKRMTFSGDSFLRREREQKMTKVSEDLLTPVV